VLASIIYRTDTRLSWRIIQAAEQQEQTHLRLARRDITDLGLGCSLSAAARLLVAFLDSKDMAITKRHACIVHQSLTTCSLGKMPQHKSAQDTSLHQLAMAHCISLQWHLACIDCVSHQHGVSSDQCSPDMMIIGTVEPYPCPIRWMINTQVNINHGRLLHLTSVSTSMTAPVCHMPQRSHAKPTECGDW